jgi:hypothetical protein
MHRSTSMIRAWLIRRSRGGVWVRRSGGDVQPCGFSRGKRNRLWSETEPGYDKMRGLVVFREPP